MAIFYIINRDNTGVIRAGDIVEIRDDCPVNIPPAPPFKIIRLAGLTRANAIAFLEAYTAGDMENPVGYVPGWKNIRMDALELAPAMKATWDSTGYLDATWAKLKKCLRSKETGQIIP